MEIDLQCNGVNITGWLQQVQSDGLLRWRPSLLSVAQGMQLWLEHLVYCASGGTGEVGLFVRKEGEWRFPPLAQEQARATSTIWLTVTCRECPNRCCCCRKAAAAWLKVCYDAEKDVMLMDEETQQKARSKFLQAYEGNMVVSGEGADVWYQRLWRTLEAEYYEEILTHAALFATGVSFPSVRITL